MTAKHLLESHNQNGPGVVLPAVEATLGLAIYLSSRESGNLKR